MDWELSERKEILEFGALSKRLGLKELGLERDGSVSRMILLLLISWIVLSIVKNLSFKEKLKKMAMGTILYLVLLARLVAS